MRGVEWPPSFRRGDGATTPSRTAAGACCIDNIVSEEGLSLPGVGIRRSPTIVRLRYQVGLDNKPVPVL